MKNTSQLEKCFSPVRITCTIRKIRSILGREAIFRSWQLRRDTMKSARTIGMLLLGLFLMLWGILSVFQVVMPMQDVVLGIIAIVAGVFIMMGL